MESAIRTDAYTTPQARLAWTVEQCRWSIEARLATLVPAEDEKPLRLSQSLRYNLLSSGKRVRGVLALLTSECFGGQPGPALEAACCIEMIHAASLALDDLPAMDNARLRRGAATSHLVFGEDTTILCSVALLNYAYQCLALSTGLNAEEKVALLGIYSNAVGLMGLTGGQELDLHREQGASSMEDIEQIHVRKTGALFAAATGAGAYIGGLRDAKLLAMSDFGMQLGTAFQIYDDLIDVLGNSAIEGKAGGADKSKVTMVTVLGTGQAELRADAHMEKAYSVLEDCSSENTALSRYLDMLHGHFKRKINPAVA